MYQLSRAVEIVNRTVVASSLKPTLKIAFNNMANALFQDVEVNGEAVQEPTVVLDTLGGDPAMIIIFRFITPQGDDAVYTFQFEAWPTEKLMRITPPTWLPNVSIIATPKMKVSFLAERNSVAYFENAVEGTFEHCLATMAKSLGR